MKTLKKRARKAYLTTGLAAIIMAVAISVIPKRIITMPTTAPAAAQHWCLIII
jgi:hypothetical protein